MTCPAYHHLRTGIYSTNVLSTLLAWDERLPALFKAPYIDDLAALVYRIFLTIFPKDKKKADNYSISILMLLFHRFCSVTVITLLELIVFAR